MARDRSSDMMSAANFAKKNVKSGTAAAGQAVAGGNFPTSLGGLIDKGKEIGQDIFNGISGGAEDLVSNLRGKNLPGKGNDQFEAKGVAMYNTALEEKDWRVKLSVPTSVPVDGLLQPLGAQGRQMIFPYTPTIIISHSAAYNTVAPIHNNYPFFAYQNSQVDAMTIVGQFYVQNSTEARYWMACLHYLRSMTKMDYGLNSTGAPPPIAKLNGYGDYVFNNVPVIIQNFTVDMPNEVDYISTSFFPGPPPTSHHDLPSEGDIKYGWAPAESQFSITVQPIYSREKQTQFNYQNFVNGGNLGQGYI
tara:strand:- start:26052 stop:26966 length:915 start_codon:yes stop_codon:yes gene_type:complete